MDGESKNPGPTANSPVRTFSCPSCGSAVSIRALGETVSVVCPSCITVIDATDENYRILSKFAGKKKMSAPIPIGRRGNLFGATYEVIGFMHRTDASGTYDWIEFLLFNPQQGFRWLSVYHGHWNFFTMIKERPVKAPGASNVNYENQRYQLFEKGSAVVKYVMGEFYWRVKVGDVVRIEDYIAPPRILSMEQDGKEIVWSTGEYVDAELVRTAFQVEEPFAQSFGVAPNQPSSLSAAWPKVRNMGIAFVIALTVIQWIAVKSAGNPPAAMTQNFNFTRGDPERVKLSGKFELKGGMGNAAVYSNAPVDNSWLDLDMDLVNDKTGQSRSFAHGLEYFHGVDSDGSWSEGSRSSRTILGGVPEGTYYLAVEALADGKIQQINYSLTVKRNVPVWSNFWISLIAIVIFPVFVGWRRRSFEIRRWSESDFSPYESSDDS